MGSKECEREREGGHGYGYHRYRIQMMAFIERSTRSCIGYQILDEGV